MKRTWWGAVAVISCILFLWQQPVLATQLKEENKQEEMEQAAEKIEEVLDVEGVDEVLESLFPGEHLSVKELLAQMLQGEMEFTLDFALRLLKKTLFGEWSRQKNHVVRLLGLLLFAAFFRNFFDSFQSRQAGESSFYVVYLLLFTLCIGAYETMEEGLLLQLTNLTGFMKMLAPVYFIATAIATGSATSIGFYQLLLVAVFLVELFLLKVLLPLIGVYLLLSMVEHLMVEQRLSKLTELLSLLIRWSLKTVLGVMVGLHLIQGILSPALDRLRQSTLAKGAEALPVIGNALGGVTEVILATALVIRNGIGLVGVLVCILLVGIPLLQMGLISLLYRVVAAIAQPISDKRIIGCVSAMGEVTTLLVRLVLTAGFLFLLTIAVVTVSTQGG